MSSTSSSTQVVEKFWVPFGKAPAMISMTYREPDNTPDPEEMTLGFNMLDALLRDLPFDQWEK